MQGVRRGSICEHGRERSRCKQCGGSQICEHSRVRSRCKECGGSQICGTVVSALCARSVVGAQSASTVVYALSARYVVAAREILTLLVSNSITASPSPRSRPVASHHIRDRLRQLPHVPQPMRRAQRHPQPAGVRRDRRRPDRRDVEPPTQQLRRRRERRALRPDHHGHHRGVTGHPHARHLFTASSLMPTHRAAASP